MNTELSIFLNQASARSVENQKAFNVLTNAGFYGVAIGLLRQELDTLIRLSYLCMHTTSVSQAKSLIEKSVKGLPWKVVNHKGKEVKITDKDMLNFANHLGGWEQVIYKFGCKLIHLSNFHLYLVNDPFDTITKEDREEIVSYLHKYHHYPKETINFDDLKPYLPMVMEKITQNVESYIEELLEKMS